MLIFKSSGFNIEQSLRKEILMCSLGCSIIVLNNSFICVLKKKDYESKGLKTALLLFNTEAYLNGLVSLIFVAY